MTVPETERILLKEQGENVHIIDDLNIRAALDALTDPEQPELAMIGHYERPEDRAARENALFPGE